MKKTEFLFLHISFSMNTRHTYDNRCIFIIVDVIPIDRWRESMIIIHEFSPEKKRMNTSSSFYTISK